jgi:alkylation response protein AidB-like acyl-CoA dehydrogenase
VLLTETVDRSHEDVLAAFRDRVDQVLRHSVHTLEPGADLGTTVTSARRLQGDLAAAGLAGLTYPTSVGGAGLPADYQHAFDDVVRRYAVDNIPLLVTLGMCVPTLMKWGSDDQRSRHVDRMLSGQEMWCQLFSEASAGSDLGGLSTVAHPVDDGWVLDGQKVWCSFAQQSEFGLCIARTESSVSKHAGLSAFIVDMSALGVEVRPIRQMTGATDFNEVFFSGVELAGDALLGRPGDGWQVALDVLGFERLQIASRIRPLLAGHADRAIATARARKLNASGEVRQRLVELVIAERILSWIANQVEANLADGGVPGAEASVLKLGVSQLASRSASLAMRLAGPSSIAWEGDDGPLAFSLLDATKLSIAGGTSEVQRNIVAERLLGLPRDPSPSRAVQLENAGGANQ